LGEGFALLNLDGDDAVCRAFADAADGLEIPLKIICDSRSGGRERYAASHVLVRPDHFVAWAGTQALPDAGLILRTAVGA
jgi:hypothetical protein